ncbi:MAG: hypothetical protein IJM44_02860 [Ruminococcus sp.]|nr:hypothetical protein [Ruminococcus sp.]
MICPACGTENPNKFKFCVKCGSNLENPQEVNIEQVDLGGYHSEEDYDSDKTGFKMSTGTFTISDSAPASNTSDLYTADELNDDEQEFDFSSYDEPFIPKLDADRLAVPHNSNMPQQPMMGQPMMYGQQPVMGGMPAQQPVMGQPGIPVQGMQQGMPQQQGMQQPMMGQPMMYGQPQLIGYDQNGMPIYGQAQPMMYAQPQLIGYDQNGMPIYGQAQPMMYAQPQLIGYDQNGMPVYSQPQPMMYGQPGMPAEGAAPGQAPYGMPQQGMPYPNMGGMPAMGAMPGNVYGAPQQPAMQPPPQQKQEERVKMSDDFWEFFDGGKATEHKEDSMDDFFGKRSDDMGGVSLDGLDMNRLQRREQKKNSYMNDTPLVNADDLAPNLDDKFNKMYMRKAGTANADDLAVKTDERHQDIMGVTRDVDVSKLSQYEHFKSRVSMSGAGEANADDLEAYVREHTEDSMDQDLRAVEALPSKKKTYNDEIDAIELPEYMQARKTVKPDSPEIPGLPEI